MAFFLVACVLVGLLGWTLGRRRGMGRDLALEKIELLLLLSAPRVLTAEHLRSAAREAFGRDPESAVERTPGGTIRDEGYAFVALPIAEPMVEEPEKASEGIAELRMRVAFAEHRAYVIVSCVQRPKESTREEAYARLGRLAAALADETTSLVYAPEVGRGLPMSEATLEGLRGGDPLATMQTVNFDAIGMVSGEDPRMVEATAEARRRLPEFVEAVRAGREACLVKGPFTDGSHTEFMWVEAKEIAGEAIRGTLMNAPFQVRGMRQGTTVEVAFDEVSDWGYVGEGGPVGLFTERIVRGEIGRS